jgi:hypothetical protein
MPRHWPICRLVEAMPEATPACETGMPDTAVYVIGAFTVMIDIATGFSMDPPMVAAAAAGWRPPDGCVASLAAPVRRRARPCSQRPPPGPGTRFNHF